MTESERVSDCVKVSGGGVKDIYNIYIYIYIDINTYYIDICML